MKRTFRRILVLTALLLTACGETNSATPPAQPAATEAAPNTVTAEGTLLPASSVELAFAQGGVASEILAQPGEILAAGDAIAQLIGLETAQAELAAARLELASAKKALNDLQNAGGMDLAQAVIHLKDAEEEYDDAVDYLDYLRNEDKVPQTETRRFIILSWKGYTYRIRTKHFKGPAPQDWIIEAENDLALHKAKMDEAQRAYNRLKGGVDAEQLPVLEARLNAAHANVTAAEAAIELYELRAPFKGELLRLDLAVGETAPPMTPVAFLADTSHWIVETKDLAEVDVANVSAGDPAIVKLDAFPNEVFTGRVAKINPVGKIYLGDMTYQITVALDEPDPRFLWNMTAVVTVNTEDE